MGSKAGVPGDGKVLTAICEFEKRLSLLRLLALLKASNPQDA
jgi:hypothetical protein